MKACFVLRASRVCSAAVLLSALAACKGGGGGFNPETAPYGPRTPTTRLQSTINISSSLLTSLSARQNTAVVGSKIIAGLSFDRLATTRVDNPSEGGEYWIKYNPDQTLDFAGFQHSDLLSGMLGAASTTFNAPIKVDLNAPVGVPQTVVATGTVSLGGSAGPSPANFTGQYTLVEKEATVTTEMGPISGCSHFSGSARSDSPEVPALLAGMLVTADLYYHPSYGVVAFNAPGLGLGTSMTGTDDCGSVDVSDYRTIRKMGVVDANTPLFSLDTYVCDGNQFAADKNTHAGMLVELRWADESSARTATQPTSVVEFGTPLGYFPNAMAMTSTSVFHPEENGKGFKYWYSFVSQAAKNEMGNSTAYHISVRSGGGQAAVRVTARIYYKTIPSLIRPEVDGGVVVSKLDGGLVPGVDAGVKDSAGVPVDARDSGVLFAEAGKTDTTIPLTPVDAPVVTPDGNSLPPGTPSIIEEFDTLPTTTTQFVPIQAAGGDFAKFATVSGGRLVVDVPAGNNWGKTGVRSKDPVFEVTADMASNPWSVVAELDPNATTGYVVVLSPTAYDDIWTSENFWANWIRHPTAGGTSATITNTQNTTDTTKTLTNTPLTAPGTVSVVARPGQIQTCTSSGWGMEGNYAWMKVGAKVYAYVFAHPYDAGMPVKLAVKSIKVVRGAPCGAAGSIPAYTVVPEKSVFADDLSAVAKNWTPIQAAGGDYTKFATTPTGELYVNVPAGNNWGKTGVRSSYFMFDIRDDMLTTPISLSFDFVTAKTSGFVIVLSPTAYDDIWTSENFWAAFVRHPTGGGAAANITNTQNTKDTTISLPNIPSEAPTSATVTVRPGHAQVCTSTGWGMEGDYAWMKTGTKVYAYVFSHPYDSGMPVQMDVTNVRVERTAACGASGAIPAYPAPAPRLLFQDSFSGGVTQNWVGIGAAGGDFSKFAVTTTNEVYVNVPAGNSWGKTGIRSNYYLFDVRSDFATSPTTVDFVIDPARTTGFAVVLSTVAYDDIWTSSNTWMAFITDPDTKLADFSLSNTQNTTDTAVSKTGLSAAMPSKVSLTVTPKHVKATLSNGQVLEGDFSWLEVGKPVYAYIFTHPFKEGQASSLAVKSISVTR